MSVPSLLSIFGNSGLPDPVYVDDVFGVNLHTANNSAVTITNGLDLAGEGGMVWGKSRSATQNHRLYDTEGNGLYPNLTYGSFGTSGRFTANSDGYDLTAASGIVGGSGFGGPNYVYWSFRKAPGFFDVVTWTGDGNGTRAIAHLLDNVPGMIIVKCTNNTENWAVYHRSLPADGSDKVYSLELDTSSAQGQFEKFSNHGAQTSSTFSVRTSLNVTNRTYVAYIFAHDDARFGTDRDESIVKCDSYTGTGNNGLAINVGFEPGWLFLKNSNIPQGEWRIMDNKRLNGLDSNSLRSNVDSGESAGQLKFTSTGFEMTTSGSSDYNRNGDTFIYIAIRKGA